MKEYIDLHMHTDRSDGSKTPAELLALVRESGVVCFSVTDHDTLEGLNEVRALLTDGDPDLISGIELSATNGDRDMHILGYLFDPSNDALHTAIIDFQSRRNKRGRQMVEKLNDLGVPLTFDHLTEVAGAASLGRPHVAEALFKNGFTSTYEEAFYKYIADGKPAYIPKVNFEPAQAISLIHKAGGVAVLAHPTINETIQHLPLLLELGIDGIEIYHPSHQNKDTERYKHLAEQHRLVVSGGSDFHGRDSRHGAVGSQKVPLSCLEPLMNRAQERKEQ